MGVLWYTLLGRNYTGWMRMTAFPLLGLIIGEAIFSRYLSGGVGRGLVIYGVHLYVALIATFIAAMVDVAVTWVAKEHHVVDALKTLEHAQQPTSN
jgi:L-cystine uptake protein TcyP (sodium:dicarboxylate symporter family)